VPELINYVMIDIRYSNEFSQYFIIQVRQLKKKKITIKNTGTNTDGTAGLGMHNSLNDQFIGF
jgi:hypothetical protein